MSDPILIEPDGPRRPGFAVWGLSQDPPIQTASASGWLVPLSLYPSIPAELLDGAYVDGYLDNGPDVQPKAEPQEAPAEPVQAPEAPATAREELPVRPVRKSRKRAAQHITPLESPVVPAQRVSSDDE